MDEAAPDSATTGTAEAELGLVTMNTYRVSVPDSFSGFPFSSWLLDGGWVAGGSTADLVMPDTGMRDMDLTAVYAPDGTISGAPAGNG